MNKIYSVVWSRSLQQLVVASELAAPGGKASGGRRETVRPGTLSAGIMTALLAMGGMGWATSAQAQANCSGPPYNAYSGSATCAGLEAQATAGGATAIGFRAFSSGLNATTLGYQALASGTNA